MPKVNDKELKSYFTSLKCGDETAKRAREIISDHRRLLGKDPEFIFLEDWINEDGNREYPNVVMLTADTYSEGKIDGESNQFYVNILRKSVWHVIFLERLNLEEDVAQANSRVSVKINFHHGGFASFDATGTNCAEVIKAIKQYFFVNMSY